MPQCPCHSTKAYAQCCAPFIAGNAMPTTPEQLMRSRYTAYSQIKIDYIAKTMKSPALDHFEPQSARKWAREVVWIDLKILSTRLTNDHVGFVEFIASYVHKNKKYQLHEISEFHKENEQWFYVQGDELNSDIQST